MEQKDYKVKKIFWKRAVKAHTFFKFVAEVRFCPY